MADPSGRTVWEAITMGPRGSITVVDGEFEGLGETGVGSTFCNAVWVLTSLCCPDTNDMVPGRGSTTLVGTCPKVLVILAYLVGVDISEAMLFERLDGESLGAREEGGEMADVIVSCITGT